MSDRLHPTTAHGLSLSPQSVSRNAHLSLARRAPIALREPDAHETIAPQWHKLCHELRLKPTLRGSVGFSPHATFLNRLSLALIRVHEIIFISADLAEAALSKRPDCPDTAAPR